MNSKATQHKHEQDCIRSEPQFLRKAINTFEQKRAEAARIAQQIADHLGNGNKMVVAMPGQTGLSDYRNPLAYSRHLHGRGKACHG